MFSLYENKFLLSEFEMVDLFIKKFKDRDLIFGDKFIKGSYFQEVRVPEIGRRSDLVIHCSDRRIINVEFKISDFGCVVSQARDHLKWCDYSYVCLPMNMLQFAPELFLAKLLKEGIGLIIANERTFVEILKARHNTYKSGKSKKIRLNVLKTLKSKMALENQKEIFK